MKNIQKTNKVAIVWGAIPPPPKGPKTKNKKQKKTTLQQPWWRTGNEVRLHRSVVAELWLNQEL